MKKIFVLTTSVIFSVSLLIGCGGQGKKAMDTAKNAVNTAQKEVTNNVKKVVNEATNTHVPNLDNGKKIYDKVCTACHMTGVAGAPALKNKKRWEENAKLGMKKLVSIAIHGNPKGKYGVMPERGSCTDCSDDDLADAVAYMVKEAGVTVK